MSVSVRCSSLLAASALLVTAAPARAEGAAVDLTWSAPAGCPGEARVRAAVERIVGHPIVTGPDAPIRVRLAASSTPPGGWSVAIAIDQPGAASHVRRIDGETCEQVADAAAVAVALALASPLPAPPLDAAAPPPPAVPAAPPIAVAGPLPPSPRLALPPSRPTTPSPAPDRVRVGLRLAGGVDVAALPAPAPGASVAGILRFGANRVEITGVAWLRERATAVSGGSAGGDIALFAAGARYCRTLGGARLEVAGCVGLEAGAMPGTGFGVSSPASAVAPWVAPQLGALGLWNLSPWISLSLSIDGLVPLVRRAFVIEGVGEVYRAPPLTGRALLGVESHFR